MVRDFGEYFWSLCSSDRKLSYFNIHSNESVSVEDVKSVVNKELMGPSRLLGCRAMHIKIKNIHGLNAPRDLVYTATKRKTNFSMHQLFYSYFIIAEQINGLVSI